MPTAVIEIPAHLNPPRKRWTRAEYDALSSSGLLDNQKLELIDKMGKGRPHVNSLTLVQGWLIGVFGLRQVNPEAPIDVAPRDNPTSEPQPDLIVLKFDLSHFPRENPGPQDVALIIEISD